MFDNQRVAILLANPEQAQALADLLEELGPGASIMHGSDQLYQTLNRSPIDLVVIEKNLGGFLTGLEIIERLYSNLQRPATVLLGELSGDEARRGRAIGIPCVLSPGAAPQEIVDETLHLLSGAQACEEVLSEAARKIVRQADGIRPLPQLLAKFIGYLGEPEIESSRLVHDLSSDALLSADLLKYANSSALGRLRKASKISEAVNFLGPRQAIGAVISAGMMRTRASLLGELPPLVRHWHSCRSVLTSCTAAAFAEGLEKISEEESHLLGLTQDLGILVMARSFGERYVENLDRVRRVAHLDLAHVEKDSYGVTHAEVSAALLRRWELPGSLVSLVLRHHDVEPREGAVVDTRFLRVMQIGEAVSDLHDNHAPQRKLVLHRLLSAYGPEMQAECRNCLSRAMAQAIEANEAFSIPAPEKDELEAMLKDLEEPDDFSMQLTHSCGDTQESDPSAIELAPSRDDMNAENARILVIDDEPSIATTVRIFLRGCEFQVLTCDNFSEGKRLAFDADLVLCDVHLGKSNGIDLVGQLRKEQFTGPVIMLTGDGHHSTVLESIQAGVNDYLLKPFSKLQLIDKLRKHLGTNPVPLGRQAPSQAKWVRQLPTD